jgi:quercetin dioxygenase-like cupin family protein
MDFSVGIFTKKRQGVIITNREEGEPWKRSMWGKGSRASGKEGIDPPGARGKERYLRDGDQRHRKERVLPDGEHAGEHRPGSRRIVVLPVGESEISYVLTRADKRERLATEIRNVDFLSLASGMPGQRFQPMLSVLKPGATSGEDYVTHRGRSFPRGEGALEVELNGQTSRLEEGDSLYFRGNTPYRWKNAAEKETQLLIVSAA